MCVCVCECRLHNFCVVKEDGTVPTVIHCRLKGKYYVTKTKFHPALFTCGKSFPPLYSIEVMRSENGFKFTP